MQHEALRFLEVLGATEEVTFQVIHQPDGQAYRPMFNTRAANVLSALAALNDARCNIYFSVNETQVDDRTAGAIRKLRAIFCDYDNGFPAEWPLAPTVTVQSSTGKLQAYWVLQDAIPTTMESVSKWEDVEFGWVRGTGADENASDLARILRVPGFYNHKYEPPVMVRIAQITNQKYTLAELAEPYKNVVRIAKPAKDFTFATAAAGTPNMLRFTRYVEGCIAPMAGEGKRNAFYYRMAAFGLSDCSLDVETVAEYLIQHSEHYHGQKAYEYTDMLELVQHATQYARRKLNPRRLSDGEDTIVLTEYKDLP